VVNRKDRDAGRNKTKHNRSSGAFLSHQSSPSASSSAHVVPAERAKIVMAETIAATVTIMTVMTKPAIVPTVPVAPEAAFEKRLTQHPVAVWMRGRIRWIIDLGGSVTRTWHHGCAARRQGRPASSAPGHAFWTKELPIDRRGHRPIFFYVVIDDERRPSESEDPVRGVCLLQLIDD
jgi:hypothetical protein